MGNCHDSLRMNEISQSALYRALCIERMGLNYQINCLTIFRNYIEINPTPKHDQERFNLSRKIMRRIIEIHKINARLKRYPHKRESKSKFLRQSTKITEKKKIHFIETLDPEVIINQENEELNSICAHANKLTELMNSLEQKSAENQEKIITNIRRAVNLTQTIKEVEDLKHYLNFLQATKNFCKNKKDLKNLSQKNPINPSSAEDLILLQQSREDLIQKQSYLESLKQKIDLKLKSAKTYQKSSSYIPLDQDLSKKLEILQAEEARQKAKIDLYKRRTHHSSLSTDEGSRDLLLSSEKIRKFSMFLSDIKSKHYHLSEIPIEFS